MKLFQILLPLQDNEGKSFPVELFIRIKRNLIEKFGGMTAFTQSPATGLWGNSPDNVIKDRIVIFEVMAENFEAEWWKTYRNFLEGEFRQDKIIIRAFTVEMV
jgi:hypothetical protein